MKEIPFSELDKGSPAWAGIDPDGDRGSGRALRFPRVGGDRPRGEDMGRQIILVPPRGRG